MASPVIIRKWSQVLQYSESGEGFMSFSRLYSYTRLMALVSLICIFLLPIESFASLIGPEIAIPGSSGSEGDPTDGLHSNGSGIDIDDNDSNDSEDEGSAGEQWIETDLYMPIVILVGDRAYIFSNVFYTEYQFRILRQNSFVRGIK